MTQRQWRMWGRVMGIIGCLLVAATQVRRSLYELAPGETVRSMPVISANGYKSDLADTMPGRAVWIVVEETPPEIDLEGIPSAIICTGSRDCASRIVAPSMPVYAARGKIGRVAIGDMDLPAVVIKDQHDVIRSIEKCCDGNSLAVKGSRSHKATPQI